MQSQPQLPSPILFEASSQALCLESTLHDLPLHQFQIDLNYSGQDLAHVFERHPSLPGAVLMECDRVVGMVSRSRFLEYLLRPQGLEWFLSQPLQVLHSYTRTRYLVLPETTPILTAAQQALRRSPDQQSEPILVEVDLSTYHLLDVQVLNIAYWQIRGIETQVRYERAQAQMLQSEKMASLGRLVDGVAHEILDPVGFIWGNLTHVTSYTNQLLELVTTYEAHLGSIPPVLQQLQREIELDYLKQDLPRAIDSVRSGADRLKKLAGSLQNFCHIDQVYPKAADLHDCLDSIVLLLKSRLTGEIEIVRNYGHLPPVSCYLGQLSQVFMNILTNAVDALLNQAIRREVIGEFEDMAANKMQRSQITITTSVRSQNTSCPTDHATLDADSRWVSVTIADNGPGLSPEQQQQILDSFTVNKRIDKETSLAASYQIITAKHGGKFYLRSPRPLLDESTISGTEFEILLPLI